MRKWVRRCWSVMVHAITFIMLTPIDGMWMAANGHGGLWMRRGSLQMHAFGCFCVEQFGCGYVDMWTCGNQKYPQP